MFYEEDLNPLKELCCSLLALIIGFAFCLVMLALFYFTYEAIVGNISYCTLWTDIPGRLAIFAAFYYGAAICGIFPVPESFRLSCLRQTFIIYKLESWKRLFRCLRLLLTCNWNTNEDPAVTETSPLRNGYNEQHYGSPSIPCVQSDTTNEDRAFTEISPLRDGYNEQHFVSPPVTRVQSDTIPILQTNNFQTRLPKAESNQDVEIENCSEENSSGSSIGVLMVPGMEEKFTKHRYISDSKSSKFSESENVASAALGELSGTNNRQNAVAKIQRKTDSPPRTHDVETPLPLEGNHPRVPWVFMKESEIAQEVRALHEKNLMIEKREIEEQSKKKSGEKVVKESKHDSTRDSDELNPYTNPPLRLFMVPKRNKTSHRDREKTTPGSSHKIDKMNVPIDKRTTSATAPHVVRSETSFDRTHEKDKCCDNSPYLESKVDLIQETLISVPSSQDGSNEASASGQDSDVVPSKNNESVDISIPIDTSQESTIDQPKKKPT